MILQQEEILQLWRDVLPVLLSGLYCLRNVFSETNENKHDLGKKKTTNRKTQLNFAFCFRITFQL